MPLAPDLVHRRFNPEAPNQQWSGDITYITYIATDEGWLYLAAVIDLFNRQVVGWREAIAHADQSGQGCTAYGLVAAARAWCDIPQR